VIASTTTPLMAPVGTWPGRTEPGTVASAASSRILQSTLEKSYLRERAGRYFYDTGRGGGAQL
jgi:hypothetical protein